MLKIGHSVTVPKTLRGPKPTDEPEIISIPEELEGTPGAPQDQDTVNFYTRNYPVESHNVENYVYRKWSREVSDIKETRDEHERLNKPIVIEALKSGDIEPTVEPEHGKDVTQEIKDKALELGFAVVGVTAYDNRYTYVSKRKWVKPYPNAICLAMEQPYEEDPDNSQRAGRGRGLRHVQERGARRAGVGGLHTLPWLPCPGPQSQRPCVGGYTHVRTGRAGPAGRYGLPVVASLRLPPQADDHHHRRSADP